MSDGAMISFRASASEAATYQRAWREMGFRSQSQFHREAARAFLNPSLAPSYSVAPQVLMETNTKLDRVVAMLRQLMSVAANENSVENEVFAESILAALRDVQIIRNNVK